MTPMHKLVASYKNTNLILRIIIGLILGAILGFAARNGVENVEFGETNLGQFLTNLAEFASIFGSLFVSALKAAAPILVFLLILSSILNRRIGATNGLKLVILLYIIGTLAAACVGVGASFLFPTTLTLNDIEAVNKSVPQNVWIVLKDLLFKIADNPFNAIANGNYVGILAWSIGLGIALKFSNPQTKKIFTDISEGVSKIVQFIIQLAPFGIFGLVTSAVFETGAKALLGYVQLVVVLVAAMGVVALVVNPIIVLMLTRKNPYPLVFTCLKDSGITAFFTRSSAANIPVNLSLCKKLDIPDELSSISIPLGATINMAGAAIVISILALAGAHTLGIEVGFGTAILLCVVSAVGACGASGVPGGSLMLIPLACSLFNIPNEVAMQIVAIGFIIGVIQDSVETAINSSTDVLFTAVAAQISQKKQIV